MTLRVVDYQIVSIYGSYNIDYKVKNELRFGWEPIGGPYVYNGLTCQAMVKYEDDTPPFGVRAIE